MLGDRYRAELLGRGFSYASHCTAAQAMRCGRKKRRVEAELAAMEGVVDRLIGLGRFSLTSRLGVA